MVLNGSFETPTGAYYAIPSDWTLGGTVQVGSFAWAELDTPSITTEAFEAFWSSNEDRLGAFVGLGVDIESAEFDYKGPVNPEPVEDFEEDWSFNQHRTEEMGAVVAAAFDTAPGPVEDFEEEWLGNEGRQETFVGVPIDLESAWFDEVPEAPEYVEDFENKWDTNEDRFETFVGIGTGLDEAVFLDADSNPLETAETFEVFIALDVHAAQGEAGDSQVVDPTGLCSVRTFGVYQARLSVQVRRRGFTTWVTVDTSDTPGTTDLDLGVSEVRIFTESYNDGTPEAELRWRTLETL